MATQLLQMISRDRQGWLRSGYAEMMRPFPDVRCFEMSQVLGLARDLGKQCEVDRDRALTNLSFLPAPATWIEHWIPDEQGLRAVCWVGYLLVEKTKSLASVVEFGWVEGFFATRRPDIPLLDAFDADSWAIEAAIDWKARFKSHYTDDELLIDMSQMAFEIHAFLALINSPRVIGRISHDIPSREKKLAAKIEGLSSKRELLPWHEIKLEISTSQDDSANGNIASECITSAKAYHFCRQHLRVRLGKLELVRAHWRGDPTLGVKQGRYTLVPPRATVTKTRP